MSSPEYDTAFSTGLFDTWTKCVSSCPSEENSDAYDSMAAPAKGTGNLIAAFGKMMGDLPEEMVLAIAEGEVTYCVNDNQRAGFVAFKDNHPRSKDYGLWITFEEEHIAWVVNTQDSPYSWESLQKTDLYCSIDYVRTEDGKVSSRRLGLYSLK